MIFGRIVITTFEAVAEAFAARSTTLSDAAGLTIEASPLPTLEANVRAVVIGDFPQPIAEAVALSDAASCS